MFSDMRRILSRQISSRVALAIIRTKDSLPRVWQVDYTLRILM